MFNILNLELKRVLKTKGNLIIFSLSIIATIFLSFFCINTQTTDIVLSDGTYKIINGREAIKLDLNRQSKIEGDITEDVLINALNKYKEFNSSSEKMETSSISNKELNTYKELFINILPYSFPKLLDMVENNKSTNLNNLTNEDVSNFYKNRSENQSDNFQYILKLSNTSQVYAKKMESQVKKPFYFSPFVGWDTALNSLRILIILLAIIGCIISTPIFSKEYTSGCDDIMRCTKYGRKHLVLAKLLASNILISILYLTCIIIFLGIELTNLNIKGLNTSIQFIRTLSPVSLTIGQAFIIEIIIGLFSVLSIVNFTLFLSTKSKSLKFIFSASIILVFTPIIFDFIIGSKRTLLSNVFRFLSNLLPSSGLNIHNELVKNFNLYEVGNIVIWSPYIIIASSLFATLFLFIFSVHSYKKHESI